jgi:hypothetical protein
MARPKPNIILSQEQDNGEVWEITECDSNYVILYKGQFCGIKVTAAYSTQLNVRIKYKKLSYPTEGSARRQVRMLNKKFNTDDFSYIKLA